MEYREIGSTGVRVSEIGFGTGDNAGLMVKGTPEEMERVVGPANRSLAIERVAGDGPAARRERDRLR